MKPQLRFKIMVAVGEVDVAVRRQGVVELYHTILCVNVIKR